MYVKKIKSERKKRLITKTKISVTISQENLNKLNELDINKSQFINWLLEQYYGMEDINNE